MCPIAQPDRHDGPWLVDELVPGKGAMLKNVVVGAKDAVWEPVVADELPDVFDRVEFGAFGRQRDKRDVRRQLSWSNRCLPAWSRTSTAYAPGATAIAISARCRFIPAILQRGRTTAAPLPSLGQMAPKI